MWTSSLDFHFCNNICAINFFGKFIMFPLSLIMYPILNSKYKCAIYPQIYIYIIWCMHAYITVMDTAVLKFISCLLKLISILLVLQCSIVFGMHSTVVLCRVVSCCVVFQHVVSLAVYKGLCWEDKNILFLFLICCRSD